MVIDDIPEQSGGSAYVASLSWNSIYARSITHHIGACQHPGDHHVRQTFLDWKTPNDG
jgi:hypothetical protein